MVIVRMEMGKMGMGNNKKNTRESEKLWASEEYFKVLVESLTDLVYILDLKTGHYTYVSPGVERMFGYTVEEALKLSLQDVMTTQSYKHQSDKLKLDLQKFPDSEKKSETMELELIRKDGSVFWGEVHARFLTDNKERPTSILGIVQDITERKKNEEQVHVLNEQLLTILDSSPAMIFYKDNKNRFIRVNEALARANNRSKQEMEGKTGWDLFPKEAADQYLQDDKEVIASGKPKLNIVESMETPTGTMWVRTDKIPYRSPKGEIVGIIGFTVDITGEKQIEEDVKDEKAAIQNILEDLGAEKSKTETAKAKEEAILASIGDGIIAVDANGKIVLMNKEAEKLLGWNINEAIGKLYIDVISLEDERGKPVSPEGKPFTKASTTTTTTTKFFLVSKNKIKFPVAITVSPIVLGSKIIGLVEVFRDISRERQIDKMKTEFISLASHQLRTPLSAIKWFVELFQGTKMDKEQAEFSNNIAQSTERMIDLVNGLLNVSRIESGRIIIDPKLTDLEALAKEVIKELQPQIDEKEVSLTFSADSNLPSINIDPKLIHEVYQNLITNAIKYTPKNGKIIVSIFRKDQDIISQVSDTGLGIPDDEKIKVFSKFYRGTNIVKVEPNGNGLGLYLAKAIMESSQGRIWFESKEGKGTTFWFSLPLSGTPKKEGEVTINS